MTTAKEWAQDKNCYFEIDKNNNSWLWLSNGHIERRYNMRVNPNTILHECNIRELDRIYNDLQDNWITIDPNEGCTLRINGIMYEATGF